MLLQQHLMLLTLLTDLSTCIKTSIQTPTELILINSIVYLTSSSFSLCLRGVLSCVMTAFNKRILLLLSLQCRMVAHLPCRVSRRSRRCRRRRLHLLLLRLLLCMYVL